MSTFLAIQAENSAILWMNVAIPLCWFSEADKIRKANERRQRIYGNHQGSTPAPIIVVKSEGSTKAQSTQGVAAASVQPQATRHYSPPPGSTVHATSLRGQWERSINGYNDVAVAYGQYESDPLKVLKMPALADPDVATTGQFIEAFYEATALRTDAFPGEKMAKQFIITSRTAANAWKFAQEAAERLRTSRFTSEENALIRQGIKLLQLAQQGATPAEQETALLTARQILIKLELSVSSRGNWRLPRPARLNIESMTHSQILPHLMTITNSFLSTRECHARAHSSSA